MSIKVELFEEPKLQFGSYFEHEDSKTGLADFGPFGKNIAGLHPAEIKLAFVGTRQTISGAREWIEEMSHPIESEKKSERKAQEFTLLAEEEETDDSIVVYSKILNRDFIGFNEESKFSSKFVLNERWVRTVQPRDLASVLKIEAKEKRIWNLVELFDDSIKSLASTPPKPDIIIIALTPEIVKEAHAIRLSGNFFLNFRRALKARAMPHEIPLQLLQRRTVTTTTTSNSMQDKATRAWNFCTAQYYKADGVPWRPISLEEDTCFIGISFHIVAEQNKKQTMRASLAQAFDYLGQGLVVRGDDFDWDPDKFGQSPHLSRRNAATLLERTLREYVKLGRVPPRRVVIHKTTEFWGTEHPEYNELDGFQEGIDRISPNCETDFVALRQSSIRLFREGKYPPLRGTYFCVEGCQHFLYTVGYIPYLETSPSAHVPAPWQITQHIGCSDPKDLLLEVLALTKMNVNNCSYADGAPITISFARSIGEIMKHVPQEDKVQPFYKFYM